jgi:transcriptional regulator with XRE-family HTH domain
MIIKNNFEKIIKAKGFKEFRPTEDLLKKLQIRKNRFSWIRSNKVQPTFEEAFLFAQWAGVTVDELYDSNELKPAFISASIKSKLLSKLTTK